MQQVLTSEFLRGMRSFSEHLHVPGLFLGFALFVFAKLLRDPGIHAKLGAELLDAYMSLCFHSLSLYMCFMGN